jgi:hypothetical protein
MTRDHAFASLKAGGETIDVETTNPYGFDPGNRKEFHDQFGALTGFAYVPVRNYRDRAAISSIELISLILSNRITELELHGHFAEAVPLAIDRAALLAGKNYNDKSSPTPDSVNPAPFFEDPQKDLMNRIFNYGASLLKAGKEDDCLGWAAYASQKYPDEKRWQEFTFAAVNNRIQKIMKAGRLGEARDFIDRYAQSISPQNYDMLETLLIDTELMDRTSKLRNLDDAKTTLAAIDSAQGRVLINAERAGELRTFTLQKAASIIAAPPDKNWLGAINYLEAAIRQYGPNRELERAIQTYRSNRVVDFHNEFAAAFNKRNFDQAGRVLDEGLKEFPDNRQLLLDRNTLEGR